MARKSKDVSSSGAVVASEVDNVKKININEIMTDDPRQLSEWLEMR